MKRLAIALLALAMPAAAALAQSSVTVFDDRRNVAVNQFADYPCSDAIGHAAKCDVVDAHGATRELHDCVDALRKHVQCVQPVFSAEVGSHGVRQVTLAMPTRDARPKPELTFREEETAITLTVSSDRREVAAVGADGKLLWKRDPFSDSGIDPYRFAVPRIEWIGPVNKRYLGCCSSHLDRRYVGVSYDSSQFGMIDVRTGEFLFIGQD